MRETLVDVLLRFVQDRVLRRLPLALGQILCRNNVVVQLGLRRAKLNAEIFHPKYFYPHRPLPRKKSNDVFAPLNLTRSGLRTSE